MRPPYVMLCACPEKPIIACGLHVLLGLAHTGPDLLLEGGPIVPPHDGGVDVGGTLVVGVGQHGNDGDEDLLDAQDRTPPLLGRLLGVHGVLTGWVEDGDANLAILVDVGVPHFRRELHLRGHVGKVLGKFEVGLEEASLVQRAVGAHYHHLPIVHIALVGQSHRDQIDRVLVEFCGQEAGARGKRGGGTRESNGENKQVKYDGQK